jgi:uncharacterized protein
VLVGMAAGALALGGPEPLLRPLVGVIVLVMIAIRVLRAQPTAELGPRAAAGYGIATGFATTVANAAGPIMNMYLLARRLPKDEFIATGAWFFLIINLTKLPIFAARGLIHSRSLAFDLVLVPAVLVGSLVGRAVSQRLPQRAFERVVLSLTAVAAVLLLLPPI